MRPLIAATLFGLVAVEGLAYWWMHPAPAAVNPRVLTWQPQVGQNRPPGPPSAHGADRDAEALAADNSESGANPQLTVPNAPVAGGSSPPPPRVPAFSLSPLPDVYAAAAPMLRCSNGQVFFAKSADSLSLHLAFFTWDHTDAGSVLEAFRHLPEACMGSIGMELVATEPPLTYHVDGTALTFDHTVFREPGQGGGRGFPAPLVHSFRAVWVADLPGADARQGIFGKPFEQLRRIRLQCALTRYRPAHACVIQGTVHGAPNSAAAWQAFESAMLTHLTWATPATDP
jgi:hypothetical protein